MYETKVTYIDFYNNGTLALDLVELNVSCLCFRKYYNDWFYFVSVSVRKQLTFNIAFFNPKSILTQFFLSKFLSNLYLLKTMCLKNNIIILNNLKVT